VTAEKLLERGARTDQPHARGVVGAQRDALDKRRAAFLELAGGRPGLREGGQELDALRGRSVPGQQVERGREPPRRARRRARGRRPPASRSNAIAARSPRRAERSAWWARAVGGAPRAASASAVRRWATSRAPGGHDS